MPASTRLCSRSSPPSSAFLSVRSCSAPAASNACAWVLPSSITSGLSLLDSAVVSFSTMPVHCWRSNVTFTSGWTLLNSAIANFDERRRACRRRSATGGARRPRRCPRRSAPASCPARCGRGRRGRAAGAAGAVVAAGAAVAAAERWLRGAALGVVEPHAASATMVNAAKPAASFLVLIVFPLVVTDRSRIVLSQRGRALLLFRRCRARCEARARQRRAARRRRPAS